MKLTKERAKKPLIEDGGGWTAGQGYDSPLQALTFTVTCHTPWVQGKGHASSYTMHLSKAEMLWTVKTWLAALEENERQAEKTTRAALPTGDHADG